MPYALVDRDELRAIVREAVLEALLLARTAGTTTSPTQPPIKTFLTISEIAAIERVSPDTIYNRTKAGKTPGAKKFGHKWRINTVKYADKRGLSFDEIAKALTNPE